MPYKEWLDDVSHWSARVLSAAAMAQASCPERSFIPEPPEADAALTIGLGLPTRQRSWQAASCPPDPASGFQFARLRANSTARGPVAFEASPLAVRMLAAGRLVGVVKLAWRGQTPWAKHILVGSSLTAPGRHRRAAFQRGHSHVCVISAASSTGVSLHDQYRDYNDCNRRRLQILLELPYSGEAALQILGRCHRANALSCPRVVLCTSSLLCERRFSAAIAARTGKLVCARDWARRLPHRRRRARAALRRHFVRTGRGGLPRTVRGVG